MNRYKPWLVFLFLGGVAWGTTFMWIRIALEEIGPLTLTAARLALGVGAVWLTIRWSGIRVPRDPKLLALMTGVGLFNTVLPMILISWAQTRVESGLTSVIVGALPLFTLIIAHLALADERFSGAKLAGTLLGFGGLLLLISPDPRLGMQRPQLVGFGAIILAMLFKAAASVFIRRRLRGQQPMVLVGVSLAPALVLMSIAAPIVEGPPAAPSNVRVWLAVLWLGLIGIAGAYLAYFFLIDQWGPARASTATYIIPLVAVTLGVLFLGETLSWKLVAGGLVVLAGLLLVSWHGSISRLWRPLAAGHRPLVAGRHSGD